jgi:hypothetical protein
VLAVQAPFNLGYEAFRKPQVIEGVLKSFSGLLRLAAITLKALLGFEVATLSGFRVFFDVSCSGGHGVLLGAVGGVGGCRLSKRMFYEQAAPLRHMRPILQTFFCHPYAVYMRPNGFAHSHLVCCTPQGI